MIYFTSDLHLGHANAIKFTNRPFQSLEQMNDGLIRNINETVMANDELWILGDFALKVNMDAAKQFRDQINCKTVHMITGNHDKDYTRDHIFQSVQHYKELKTEYGKFILFHYPIYEWNGAHNGTIHLHGHIHSTGSYNTANLQKKYIDRFPEKSFMKDSALGLRIYDIGVDANNYRPISITQIAELMNLRSIKEELT